MRCRPNQRLRGNRCTGPISARTGMVRPLPYAAGRRHSRQRVARSHLPLKGFARSSFVLVMAQRCSVLCIAPARLNRQVCEASRQVAVSSRHATPAGSGLSHRSPQIFLESSLAVARLRGSLCPLYCSHSIFIPLGQRGSLGH